MDGKEVVMIGQEKREIGEPITKELILSYMNSFGIGATLNDNEKAQFINVAVAYRLNPFKREIYCNPYETKNGRKLSIITGYEVYLKRAERVGDLDGWKVTTTGYIKDHNLKAHITIHRKSWSQPFEHEVEFSEYNLNQSVWLTKPITMIKKVVTAQGFRLAFPDELGGMPYTADELPGEMTGIPEAKSTPQEPPRRPERATPSAQNAVDTPPSSAKPADLHSAIGFITNASEPNKGGFCNFTIEGYQKENGKDTQFSTRDSAMIETLLTRREAGEKVCFTYQPDENPRFASKIIELMVVQESAEALTGE